MKIEIVDMDHNGSGIGRYNGKVIFVPKTVPGDIVLVSAYKKYKNYEVVKVNKIIKYSELRVPTKCIYYDICGGCNISNLDYSKQLEFKVNKVKNIFLKYLNILVEPKVIDSMDKYKYRNKITYHNKLNLGLIGEFDDVINISECQLVSDKVNEVFNEIKKKDISQVKEVSIRECDNGIILSVDGSLNIDRLKEMCLSIYLNNKCVYKKEDGYIYIGDIKYIISKNSFFQINTSNISRLYDEIVRYGSFSKDDRVIDLYCGVGSISLYVSGYVRSVLGIEICEDAILDAKKNAVINNINNVEFLCGDVSKIIDNNISCDVLIVDPPRSGIDKHSSSIINNSNISKIIYVSCNPMTLVRDIKYLDNYDITDISVVDMFPQTHHCESITVLERR